MVADGPQPPVLIGYPGVINRVAPAEPKIANRVSIASGIDASGRLSFTSASSASFAPPQSAGAIRGPCPESARLLSDTLSSTGSQPTPPQPEGPEVGPEIQSLLHLETFPIEIWDKISKGKIKRHISGTDAVNLAQKDPRS
jgi:hypothetical protein